jgi:hypothetical protein
MIILVSTVVLAVLSSGPMAQALPSAQTRQTPQGRTLGREMTLALSHAPRQGETVWLLVEVGAIGHNQIELTTQDGQPLGTISPYGIRSGQAAGTYTIPIPSDAFKGGRLALRLSMMRADRTQRAPTAEEVKSVRLVIR